MSDISLTSIDAILGALGEQLAAREETFELVIVGGSALLALGLVERTTRDVDVMALRIGAALESAEPLPEGLRAARGLVARDFSLPADWLNPGPTSLLREGPPAGFLDRAKRRVYGPGLTVRFASRYDQIHFKLYAAVDMGPGKHERDLRALEPTREELLAAALWSISIDPSPGYAEVLGDALASFGVEDVDLRP